MQYVAVVRTLAFLLPFVAAATVSVVGRASPGSQLKLCGGVERSKKDPPNSIELHPVLELSSRGCHLA